MRNELGWYNDDCGVCALSTWARVPYDTAHDALWPDRHPRSHGTYVKQVREAMARLGFGAWVHRRCTAWDRVPPGSIVGVDIMRAGKLLGCHWVVKAPNGDMRDCYKPFRILPPPSYKITGYLEQETP